MAEDRNRQVRVTYRRYVSDSNYGTEGAEVSLEWYLDGQDGKEDSELADEMLAQAHDLVHARLRRSLNSQVRRAVTKQPTASLGTAATVPSEDEEALPF